jgi:hypothetical protein
MHFKRISTIQSPQLQTRRESRRSSTLQVHSTADVAAFRRFFGDLQESAKSPVSTSAHPCTSLVDAWGSCGCDGQVVPEGRIIRAVRA